MRFWLFTLFATTLGAEIRSYDVFDTLVGRLHYHPDSIFEQVEKQYPFPDFVFYRKSAEKLSNGTLQDVYCKLKRLANLDEIQAKKLMDYELATEERELFPIQENLKQIQDGDILISDSYYSSEQIRRLLQGIGLNKSVIIHASPSGKSSGTIWQKAKEWNIALHLGDNLHSDVKMAEKHNIAAKHYTKSSLSTAEKAVQSQNADLAYLMRALRLQNPYGVGTTEAIIWEEQAQINIPILIECSLYLDKFCKEHKKSRILFSSRDGCLWKTLFEALFPQYDSLYFHTSRHVYKHPSKSYIDYVRSVYTEDTVIVDGQGSGDTCVHFFKKHLGSTPCYLAIVLVDMLQFRAAPPEILAVPRHGIMKTSQGFSDKIERLNCDLVGTLKDFQDGIPVRLAAEYDLKNVIPSHECLKKAIELLPLYSLEKYQSDILAHMLRSLEH